MKADYQKLATQTNESSFTDFWVKAPKFGFHWHYHPEIEICYVKKGRGRRVIGENVSDFKQGDLVLVGENVPHSWITDEQFNLSDEQIEVFVVQFLPEVFTILGTLSEFKHLNELLQQARRGIYFPKVSEASLQLLEAMSTANGLDKMLLLVSLLQSFNENNSKVFLCSEAYNASHKKHQEERILKVCNHIHEHYKNNITIDELAKLVAMNKSSFCRFFKRILGMTVLEYITGLRVSYAINQLQNTSDPIYKIAYDSGFSSLSHFNKQFKSSTQKTPKAFRNL